MLVVVVELVEVVVDVDVLVEVDVLVLDVEELDELEVVVDGTVQPMAMSWFCRAALMEGWGELM